MAIAFLVGGGGSTSRVEYVSKTFSSNTSGYFDVADPQGRLMEKARISVNVPQPPTYSGSNTVVLSSPSNKTIYVGGKQCPNDIVVQLDSVTKSNLTGPNASDCIASGVTLLGILGTYRGSTSSNVQTNKTVTLGDATLQSPVRPDSGYNAMDKVVLSVDHNAIKGSYILSGHSILGISGSYTVEDTARGIMQSADGVIITPSTGYDACKKAAVSLSTADRNALKPTNILYGNSILGISGSHRDQDAVSKKLTSRDQELIIRPDTGYDAIKQVTVSLTAADKSAIIPSNIRAGETILGITGTYAGGSSISVEDNRIYTVHNYTEPITIRPSDTSRYEAMRKVTLTVDAESKVVPAETSSYTTFGEHTIRPSVTNGLMTSATFTIDGADIIYSQDEPLAPGHHTISLDGGNRAIKSVDFWVESPPSVSFVVDATQITNGVYIGDTNIPVKGRGIGKIVPEKTALMPVEITLTGAQYVFYPEGREATGLNGALEPGTIEIFNVYDDVVIKAECFMQVWNPVYISISDGKIVFETDQNATRYKVYDNTSTTGESLLGYFDSSGGWVPNEENTQ